MKLVILETRGYIGNMGKAITSPDSERAARLSKERHGGYAKAAVKIKSFRTYAADNPSTTPVKARRRAATVISEKKRKK